MDCKETSTGDTPMEEKRVITHLQIPEDCEKLTREELLRLLDGNLTQLESVTTHYKFKSIGARAFEGCTSLKRIELTFTLSNIQNSAFHGCSALEEVVFLPHPPIWDGVRIYKENLRIKASPYLDIGSRAFADCTALRRIELPKVDRLGSYAFENCTNLEEVIIYNRRIDLREAIFSGITGHIKIAYSGSAREFQNKVNVVLHQEVEGSGDYHHPSATHFTIYYHCTFASLFATTQDEGFTCQVECQDGGTTLQFTSVPYTTWKETFEKD